MNTASVLTIVFILVMAVVLTFTVLNIWEKVKHKMVFLTQGGVVPLTDEKNIEIAYGKSKLQRFVLVMNSVFILSGLFTTLEIAPAVNNFNLIVSHAVGLPDLSSALYVASAVFLAVFEFAILTFSGDNLLLELYGFYSIGGEVRRRISIQKITMMVAIGVAYISMLAVVIKILT